jgi:hypothetical protein
VLGILADIDIEPASFAVMRFAAIIDSDLSDAALVFLQQSCEMAKKITFQTTKILSTPLAGCCSERLSGDEGFETLP